MDDDVALHVDIMERACMVGDRAAFLEALGKLKQGLGVGTHSGSIGPGLAFGTLSPAGDVIGKAMRDGVGERVMPLLDTLASDESAEIRCIACRAVGHVGAREPQAVVALAHRLAADDSWEVREFIANALDEVMGKTQGDFVYTLMQQWARDPDANVRRAPTNALMRYGREHPEHVIELMQVLLHDESRYVRENVVFCLSVMGAAKVQALGGMADPTKPPRLLAALRQWVGDRDERNRWIIAKTLGRAWVKSCPAEALALLRVLAGDERKTVRVAVQSSVKAVAKACPAEAATAMADWGNDASSYVRSVAVAPR